MMKRLWLTTLLLLLSAVPLPAQELAIARIDGGGSSGIVGGNLRLNGAIGTYGLPDGAAGRSQAGNTVLFVGYYPVLADQLRPRSSTDPAWYWVSQIPAKPSVFQVHPATAQGRWRWEQS